MNLPNQVLPAATVGLSGGPQSLPLSRLGNVFSMDPSFAAQEAGPVLMGTSGLTHLTKSLSPASLNPLSGLPNHSDAELKVVSQNFEAIFMRMLMKEMRNSVPRSKLLGNSQEMQFFESMYDDQLSQKLASAGGIGIGRMVYQRLKQVTQSHQKTFS